MAIVNGFLSLKILKFSENLCDVIMGKLLSFEERSRPPQGEICRIRLNYQVSANQKWKRRKKYTSKLFIISSLSNFARNSATTYLTGCYITLYVRVIWCEQNPV